MAKISVCIPTYNRASMLRECLSALRKQTIDKSLYQIIISDNGSADNTPEIIRQFDDLPIQSFRQSKNLGLKANVSFAISACETEYCLILADDDWLTPGYLQRAVEYLDEHPEIVLYGGDASYHACFGGNTVMPMMRPSLVETRLPLPAEGIVWAKEEFISMCAIETPIFIGSVTFRTDLLQKELPAVLSLDAYFSSEKILYSRLLQYGDVFYDGWVGTCVRWHSNNETHKFSQQAQLDDLRYTTLTVLQQAYKWGIDVPLFWHQVMHKTDARQRQFLVEKMVNGGAFTPEEVVGIAQGDFSLFTNLRSGIQLEKEPAGVGTYLNLAQTAYENRNYEKAGEYYLAGLEKYPRSAKLWVAAGKMALKLNDRFTAKMMAEKALGLYSSYPEAQELLNQLN